jgi:hypothetical protein
VSIENAQLTGMLHKVRSLLDKAASDGVPQPERDLLNAKAHELIARYGIDAAMLAERDPETDKVHDQIITVAPPYVMDKLYLLNEIAKPLRVLVVLLKRADGTRTAQLFGYGSDLQRTEILFASLLLQAAHGLARARPVGRESVAAFRRTWLAGFAHEVGDRLSQAENSVAADTVVSDGSRSVALVLADRSATVELALRTAHPKVRPAKRTLSGSGIESGRAAGTKANLGNGHALPKSAGRRQLG